MAKSPISPELNDRYMVDFIFCESESPRYTYSLSPFRIMADGTVKGRANFGSWSQSGKRVRWKSNVSGRVTRIQRSGGVVSATVTGRSRGAKFTFKVHNFSGQPDLFRGEGVIRFRGKSTRVKMNNDRAFAGMVKI